MRCSTRCLASDLDHAGTHVGQLVLETLSRRVETKQNRPKRVADNFVITALTVGRRLPDGLGLISLAFGSIDQIKSGVILTFRVQKHQDLKIYKR